MNSIRLNSIRTAFASGLLVALFVFSSLASQFAHGASVDDRTRDILISKLTQVYLNLAPNDPSKVAVTLRLADLHAERGRQAAMKELDSGCVDCTAGKADRKKALVYYTEVLPKVPETSVGKVLSQVGHLHELIGQEKEAIGIYNKILAEMKAPGVVAEAHLSLAEVYFKKRDYAKAQTHYTAVLNTPESASKGLAAYRLAWCQFNDGLLDPAIQGLVKILSSPELLTRSGSAGIVNVDKQFQEEVSRDFATFLSRRPVKIQDAEQLFTLSPDSTKLQNVSYFANELERLGQVPMAIQVWRFVQERQSKPEARLEGHIHLAQLQMEQKLRAEAIKDFEAGLMLWDQVRDCQTSDCKELKARLRKFVLDWNRAEKKEPSPELLAIYQSYLKSFPGELDMILWAAQVASQLKENAVAFNYYKNGVEKLDVVLKTAKDQSERAEAQKNLEAALLSAIEVAELSKDSGMLDTAYDRYLVLSRDRKKAVEVQYQKAHIVYEKGEYAKAASLLKEVALLKTPGSTDVKKQAADLSLDALVLVKDDENLEAWAREYAKVFGDKSKEFEAIARKSVLTQAVQKAGTPAIAGSLEQAWATLSRFDLATATPEEKAAFYKNKLILAEKLQRFPEAREVVEQLLRVPNLAEADKQYAMTRKAWLAELVLDFDTALSVTEKLNLPELTVEQRLLKLAMFADLAQKDPRPFYARYLKETKDQERALAIAARLVRESKESLKEIEKQKTVLAKDKELLAQLYLEIYAQNAAPSVLKTVQSQNQLANTPAGKILNRISYMEEFAKLKAKVVSHQLDGSNQKKMAATLKGRAALLEQLEKMAQKAVEAGDWTSQLVSLDLLSKQSDRFYQEILSLPIPAGLSPEDEQQYLTLLSQQASPYQLKAKDVATKVSEFWKDDKALVALESSMKSQTGALRKLVVSEVGTLTEVAPEKKKSQLAEIAKIPETGKEVPTLASIETAKQGVRENPMSREKIESLLSLEKKMGRGAMVAYLETRLQTLEQTPGSAKDNTQTEVKQ